MRDDDDARGTRPRSRSGREREREGTSEKEETDRGTGGVSDRRMRAGAFETRRAFPPTPAARVARSVVHGRSRGVDVSYASRRPEPR